MGTAQSDGVQLHQDHVVDQFFRQIPRDLYDAAIVDGAAPFQIYWRVVMPLSGPVIATAAILKFLYMYNQYLWPLMVTQDERFRPVMVGLQYFFQLNPAWGENMAYLSLITVPVLALPPAMVAGLPAMLALGPLPGAVKVTRPPLTGSLPVAVTETESGLANAVPVFALWLLPLPTASVKPRDSKAPTSTVPDCGRAMPRWSVAGAPLLFPASMAGLPGSRANVGVGPP